MWNFDEIDKKLEAIGGDLGQVFADMQLICANQVKAVHRKRLDNGVPKRSYKSQAYKKIRANNGRQTDYIDMQFKGEFVRGLDIGTESDDVVYGVVNRRNGKTDNSTIYQGQKNNYPELVNVNSDDVKQGVEAANIYFIDQIREIFAENQ